MGRLYFDCLGGQSKIYCCNQCKTYLTNSENIISKNFRSQSSSAYLFKLVVNIETYEATEKDMTTGVHIVRDLGCKLCKNKLGWMYEMAMPQDQRYKEGCFILECAQISESNGIKNDPNFEPYSGRQLAQQMSRMNSSTGSMNDENSSPTPLDLSLSSRNSSAELAARIQNFATLLNDLPPTFNAQAFMDMTAAVASVQIPNSALNRSVDSAVSNLRFPPFTVGSGTHPTRRSIPIRRIARLPSPADNNSNTRTRYSGFGLHRQTSTSSRGSTESGASSSSSSSSSLASIAMANAISSRSRNSASLSASAFTSNPAVASNTSNSNSLETAPMQVLGRRATPILRSAIRRLAIDINPTRASGTPVAAAASAMDDLRAMEDLRELRSGRRVSRSGAR